jgi:predicted transcriptional regulator
MSKAENHEMLSEIVAEIVSAYVSNNAVPLSELSSLISSVETAVSRLTQQESQESVSSVPAANPKRSVHPDYIISLEDGKRYKSLKRHLAARHGMTPDEYRAKWGLPDNYPMVAPNYAAERSRMAKQMGLGRKPGEKAKRKAAPKSR